MRAMLAAAAVEVPATSPPRQLGDPPSVIPVLLDHVARWPAVFVPEVETLPPLPLPHAAPASPKSPVDSHFAQSPLTPGALAVTACAPVPEGVNELTDAGCFVPYTGVAGAYSVTATNAFAEPPAVSTPQIGVGAVTPDGSVWPESRHWLGLVAP